MLSALIAQDDDNDAETRLRREQMVADTYSAPATTVKQWQMRIAMSTSDEDADDDDLAGFSERAGDERMRMFGVLTALVEEETKKRVMHRRSRRRIAKAVALREAQRITLLNLTPAIRAQDGSVPLADLDASDFLCDALSDEDEESSSDDEIIPPLLPEQPKRPVLTDEMRERFQSYVQTIDDLNCETRHTPPHVVSFEQAKAYLVAIDAEQIDIEFYGCTQALIMSDEYVFTSHTAILGNDNVVFGSSNMFIGNRNSGSGAFLRARGADNRLSGRYCTNYDSGEKGEARGLHSTRIKIHWRTPSVPKPIRLSKSAIAQPAHSMAACSATGSGGSNKKRSLHKSEK